MPVFVYVSDDCESDIVKHDFKSLYNYREQTEADQDPGVLDRYPRPFLKRNAGRKGRLILEERRLGEDVVYVWLRVLIKEDGGEYDAFIKSARAGEAQAFLDRHGPTDAELRAWLEERKHVDPRPLSPTSPSPSTCTCRARRAVGGAQRA